MSLLFKRHSFSPVFSKTFGSQSRGADLERQFGHEHRHACYRYSANSDHSRVAGAGIAASRICAVRQR
ncbi:hypothetical protein GNZ12_08925 [Paraburkholderia sp. 1N]|uniref:Uncharacterized protein n=1 Tax=Paraburkholderia solitsugae TaxID=2675748 RepID=A0ABX2BKH2_9BURK|nr:hypothetical protein [Paraburkholderia solitsugae]